MSEFKARLIKVFDTNVTETIDLPNNFMLDGQPNAIVTAKVPNFVMSR